MTTSDDRHDKNTFEQTEELFTFPGGTVPLPALRDPATGERFYLPAVAQVRYNLTHHFTPAQAAADAAGLLTAEVWVHDNQHAELLSVTGCVHAHIWEDLKTDLTENSPELPEGAYTVPVDRDNTDPTGMASGAYTYYLDWKRAVPDRALAHALKVRDRVNVAELHRLAVEASRTDSTSSKVRHARDELVRVCLSLGGEAAPAEAPADEGETIPPEIVEIVTLIGPAQWSRTPAYTPEEHGEGVARSVRLTAEHFNQGDEPQHMQMLVRDGTDIVIGYIGTSPHSGQIARALTGAWNHLHQLCVQKAGGES